MCIANTVAGLVTLLECLTEYMSLFRAEFNSCNVSLVTEERPTIYGIGTVYYGMGHIDS